MQTVPKADKIFGPGNQWVTAAKLLVQNDTDALTINMPGPLDYSTFLWFHPILTPWRRDHPFWGKAKVNIVDVCQVIAWVIADETCLPAHVDADQQYCTFSGRTIDSQVALVALNLSQSTRTLSKVE
jgi:hypothetical protein